MVDVRQVTLTYRRFVGKAKPAVTDLTLQVQPGEIHALVGPNGAGKTTLLRAMVGLLRPASGSVRVMGKDPAAARAAIMVASGILLDGTRPLPPRWTALELLRFTGTLHGMPANLVTTRSWEMLERFGLADVGHHLINRFSRGMRQRLAIAATLLNDPDLLFLDEPTLGLDTGWDKELQGLLLAMRARGKAIMITTHEMDLVERIADQVTILHQGRLMAHGTCEHVALMLGAKRQVHVTLDEVPDSIRELEGALVEGNTVHAPVDPLILGQICDEVVAHRGRILSIQSDVGLEQVIARMRGEQG